MGSIDQVKLPTRVLVIGDETSSSSEITVPETCKALYHKAEANAISSLWRTWGPDYSVVIIQQTVWEMEPIRAFLAEIRRSVAILGVQELLSVSDSFEAACDAVIGLSELGEASILIKSLCSLTKAKREMVDASEENAKLCQRVRVLDQLSEAVIGTDLSGRIKAWNQRAETMFGYTRQEVIGKPLKFIFDQAHGQGLELHKILEPLLVYNRHTVETDIRTRNGLMLPIHASLTLERNSRSDIVGFICCCRDISLRRRVEGEKRAAYQRLTFFIERMPLGFIEWGLDGSIRAWNRAAETIFGYTQKEALGQPFTILIRDNFIEDCQKMFALMKEQKGGYRSSNHNVTRDGRVVTCEWNNTPLLDDNEQVIGFASIVEDITDRIRTEDELTRSREAARSANRSKDEFLAVMSHEVRTPMNSIIGFADLLMESLDDSEQTELVNIIKANAFNLLELISNVLNYSRLEAGQVLLQEQDTDIAALLVEIEEVVQAEAVEKHLGFHYEVVEGTPMHVLADYLELRQVLLNLTANAVKFTQVGEVRIRVSAKKLAGESPWQWELTFEVMDTGIGIDDSAHGKLFQSFTQLDSSSTRRFGGTGLGLAICRRIVELWQGHIWAKRNEPQGSIFGFTLPTNAIVRAEEVLVGNASYDELADEQFVKMFPLKVVLISSSQTTQEIIERLLGGLGYPVAIHDEGVEAVNYLQNKPADLVFIDDDLDDFTQEELIEIIQSGQAGPGNSNSLIALFTEQSMSNKDGMGPEFDSFTQIRKPIITRNVRLTLRKLAVEYHTAQANRAK
ncbi:MAG: PAS domain S-box protein [Verrucomicrobiota bacterium]